MSDWTWFFWEAGIFKYKEENYKTVELFIPRSCSNVTRKFIKLHLSYNINNFVGLSLCKNFSCSPLDISSARPVERRLLLECKYHREVRASSIYLCTCKGKVKRLKPHLLRTLWSNLGAEPKLALSLYKTQEQTSTFSEAGCSVVSTGLPEDGHR